MERPPDSYCLVWSNENGNVAMSTLVFDDQDRAIGWAKDEHKARGATGITVDKARRIVTGYHGQREVTWTLFPVWNVPKDYDGALSVDNSESLR